MCVRFPAAGICLCLLALVAGCGRQEMGSVSGKVTVDKKALPKGLITFMPVTGNSFNAQIKDGEYQTDEMPTGVAKVIITNATDFVPGPTGSDLSPPPKVLTKKPIAANERYQSARTSGLEFTVKAGKNTYDLDLEP